MRQNPRNTIAVASLILLLAIVAGVSFWPSASYGEIGEEGYMYATALYSIVNQRDVDRLKTFEEKMAESYQAKRLTDQEHRWLSNIVTDAKAGKWEKAQKKSRRLLEDQVEK